MSQISCSLCGPRDCQSTTVPAGEAAVNLAVCGWETTKKRLPRLTAAEQIYSSGLCPSCALEKGTLFPELVSEY